ncbi:hypothetical protein RJ639_025719 [Escallonia herrerae]|uniref:Uncharacterized protein n=1 Tax=Escallonia herrerae TaxID=1293975 RepID=A0AA88RVG9_9ASTE|nr:hypothetical protein RJ639_025719 [Escallonia herrerae]
MVGKKNYVGRKSESAVLSELLGSDLKEVAHAAKRFASHAIKLGSLGFGTSFLEWIACFAAIIGSHKLENEHAYGTANPLHLPESSFLTVQLVQCYASSSHDVFQVGYWIKALVHSSCLQVVHITLVLENLVAFTDWLDMPAALILIIVVAPSLLADTLRDSILSAVICLIIGGYLLQEHIRASGGFRNSFTKSHGISNSVGIILLLVYPVWALVLYFL